MCWKLGEAGTKGEMLRVTEPFKKQGMMESDYRMGALPGKSLMLFFCSDFVPVNVGYYKARPLLHVASHLFLSLPSCDVANNLSPGHQQRTFWNL